MQSRILIILLSLSASYSLAENPCSQQCQLDLINRYFHALDSISKAGSTPDDITKLLELCHQDVKYEHIEYGANFDKATWHAAFTRNAKRGAYNAPANRQIRVLNHIHGKNHVAIAYARGKVIDGNWKADEDKTLMVLFGFKEGKILLVREYW